MTRLPFLSVVTVMRSMGICSATRGLILGLKPPVPAPMMMRPSMNAARVPVWLSRTPGAAEATRMMWPTMAIPTEIMIVFFLMLACFPGVD